MRLSFLYRFAVCTLLSAFLSSVLFAQTNPSPFDLSSGNYSFSQWDATNAAGTFPPSMRLHMYSTTSTLTVVEPLVLNYEMNSDWDAAYNIASGARFIGSGVDGLSYLNTSSSFYSPTRFAGAAVVGLNTTNRVNIRVSWTGGTVVPQTRFYAIVLQYRVGTTDAWTTAIQNATDTVQYKSNSTAGHSQAMPTFTLPSVCENQPNVQLRWRYYQWSTGSGSRPQLRLDEISVQSDASAGVPVKFNVLNISPAIPSVLTPFSVTVQTLSNADQVRNVTQNTGVQLSLFSGTGSLLGTLTGTMNAGTNTLTLSGLTYTVAESNVKVQISRTSGDVLSSATSAAFTVLPRAQSLNMSTIQANAFVGVPLSTITVTARRADLSTDLNYPGPISLSKVSGPGTLSGTLSMNPVNGVVTFNDISFSAPGTYVISADGSNVSSATSGSIVVVAQPTVAELIMPQYMGGRSIVLPTWALVRLDGLQPNTAYRYYTAAAEINNLVGFAAGTNVHYNAPANTFNYVANSFSDFSTPGRYSEFTTGAGETSKTLWMNLVPSSNSRFTAGNNMYWYITFRDTTRAIETRFVTTGTTKTLNISTAAGDATGISDTASTCDPKTVICLYDNVSGTGNPLSTALVQDDATSITAAPVFYTNIDSKRTAWATLIPNTLASGVRRVEQRSVTTGNVMKIWIDDDGVWTPVSTVNPRGGNNAVIFPTPQVLFPVTLAGTSFCSSQPAVITWAARGINTVDLQISSDGVNYTTFASGISAALGTYTWNIPDNVAGGNNLRLRIVDTERPTTVFDVSGFVNVNTPATIITDPKSLDACLGGSATLSVQANGTALRFQWEKDGQILSGQTGPIMTITNVSNGSSGLYRCLVNGGAGCPGTASKYALISILPELTMVSQPQSVAVPNGATALLSVEVSLQNGATYQWYRGTTPLSDNSRISGSRSSTISIRLIGAADYGNDYNCRIVTTCGAIRSAMGSIASANISFSQQPSAVRACSGTDATFTLSASSATNAALTYQWTLAGKDLSEGTKYTGTKTNTLIVRNVSVADTGRYQCTVKAANGATGFSSTALLTIGTAPNVLQQSGVSKKCIGDTATLSVLAVDTLNTTYQWWYNGSALAGASSSSYKVVVATASAGNYICILSNDCGLDSARECAIQIIPSTAITTQPRPTTTRPEGSTLLLSIVAEGTNLKYQWFFNGRALSGDTTNSLSVLKATTENAGRYTCTVIGDCGTVVSDTAVVVITPDTDVLEMAEFGFSLDQSTPNPASNVASVQYQSDASREVEIFVSDFLGRPVAQLFNGLVEAGRHTAQFNCSELPTGTYFIHMRSNNVVLSKRMAVIH